MKTKAYLAYCIIAGFNLVSTAMGEEEVCVVYAHMVEYKSYVQKIDYPEPLEATLDIGIFEVVDVARGSVNVPRVNVPFSRNTLRGGFPTNAILVLTHIEGTDANYNPIGGEAWRGILPDTPENRLRIESLTNVELSQTPVGEEISEAAARQIALQNLGNLNIYTGFSGKYKILSAAREPFGWSYYIYVLDERESPASVNPVLVRINDEGELVTCRINSFDTIYDASEWDTIPEL